AMRLIALASNPTGSRPNARRGARRIRNGGDCLSAAKTLPNGERTRTSIRNNENERTAPGETALDARADLSDRFLSSTDAGQICAGRASGAVRIRTAEII